MACFQYTVRDVIRTNDFSYFHSHICCGYRQWPVLKPRLLIQQHDLTYDGGTSDFVIRVFKCHMSLVLLVLRIVSRSFRGKYCKRCHQLIFWDVLTQPWESYMWLSDNWKNRWMQVLESLKSVLPNNVSTSLVSF